MCSGAPRSAGHGHELELEELSRFDDLLDLTPSQDLPGGGDGHRVGAVADEGAAAGAGLDEPLGDQHADRLAHRAEADGERVGELAMARNALAGLEAAVADLLAQLLRHGL
jgi:hypothetical protein